MTKVQRQEEQVFERLRSAGQLSNEQAQRMLGVSASTVRRLFMSLEASGRAVRKFGGLQYVPDGKTVYSFEEQEVLRVEEKQAIAAEAAKLVESDDALYIDWGTTVSRLCVQLAKRVKGGEIQNVTVFTNSMTNISLLSDTCSVFCVGGMYRANRKEFTGYLAEETVRNLAFTKAFVSSDGYNPALGFTTFDFNSARLCEAVFANANQKIVLMDSSKYDAFATVSFSRRYTVDLLITNARPPESAREAMQRQVKEVRIAPGA
ncbi:MAG: DeoR/GlpR family DNA-binding transcription regulator [Oscillospiraceae bacterium]|jgi:DeoR family fructose operon transcriptional repressor|nr:DeoR/GlpR family DNA-binding transcription regulator [Oscillospiraceae bacterium]